MQHIQDKDLDQLFKDRFEEAEIEPSANLWSNIEQELAPAKKRRLPVYWMAAAVVLLVGSIALLLNKQEKIQSQGLDIVSNTKHPVQVTPKTNLPLPTKTPDMPVAIPTTKTQATYAGLSNTRKKQGNLKPKSLNPSSVTDIIKKDVIAMQPKATINHLPNIDQITKTNDVVQSAKLPENPIVTASVETPVNTLDGVINENAEASKKGIRNIGDLVNYVVNKVDKREEKLLQFNTDDDENSSLVSVNIGFIKFNSRKHK